MSKIEERIKELRLEIDHLSKMVNPFHEGQHNSTARRVSPILSFLRNTFHNLKLAKAWLGLVMEEIGGDNPYAQADGNRKTVEDITPTAESAKRVREVDWGNGNIIEILDGFREEIGTVKEEVNFLYLHKMNTIEVHRQIDRLGRLEYNYQVTDFLRHAHKHLSEVRFELGFASGRIKDRAEDQAKDPEETLS
jgi:hypothetical protein